MRTKNYDGETMSRREEVQFGGSGSAIRQAVHVVVRCLALLILFSGLSVSSFSTVVRAQNNVGIGTVVPDASALLDLTSTDKGLLVPRMTQTQRSAIVTPATGLLVYCTDSVNASNPSTFYYYTGTIWVPFLGSGWLLTGNSGTTAGSNFLGTKDSVDFIVKTNNLERMRVYAAGNVALTNSNNSAEELRFFEPSSSGSNYSAFKATVQSANVTYTLPPADGNGTNYVLCTDGFGTLTWRGFGVAGGGGVDTLWSRGGGKDALQGIGQGNTASGDYSIASGYHNTSSGAFAVTFGANNRAIDSGATVSGGQFDTASGKYSVVGGGFENSATGNYSFVGGGENNSACGLYSVVAGGFSNTACGEYSVVLGGHSNNASGNFDVVFGVGANVTQDSSIVFYNSSTALKLGIGTVSPTEALDVSGNLKFSGALMPNNLPGTSGFVLASTGASTAPVWTAASNLYWSTLGNTGTSAATNYLGTTDAQPFIIRTNNTERLRVLSTGNIGINTTTPLHPLHSVYTGTTDEIAAIFGNTNASTTNQAVGVWGAATNAAAGNTGTIGVLATGNGNTTAGQTNVALQINDGEFAMGRTTETPSVGTVVEGAAAGTAHTAQVPSGVIELTLGATGNLVTAAPTSGTFQNLGTVTINNRYASASSIVIVSVENKTDDGVAPDCKLATYFVDVDNRANGAFDIRVGMIPTTTSVSNYTTSDKIRIGYTIINAGR